MGAYHLGTQSPPELALRQRCTTIHDILFLINEPTAIEDLASSRWEKHASLVKDDGRNGEKLKIRRGEGERMEGLGRPVQKAYKSLGNYGVGQHSA